MHVLRYQMAALIFKAFSATPQTQRFYRWLGNQLCAGTNRFNDSSIHKLQWTLENWRKHRRCQTDRPWKILEVGTGWAHQGGLFLACMEDAELTLFDVWDNRQFKAYREIFAAMKAWVGKSTLLDAPTRPDALKMFDAIENAGSLDEVYRIARAVYIVDPGGDLHAVADDTQDLVFSLDVLEHIPAENVESAIRDHFRVLRPGGIALHVIGVDDHLAHYDRRASKKQFLAYGDREWDLRFANVVQHFNRVSCDRYRKLCADAGFELVDFTIWQTPEEIERFHIAQQYRDETRESLCATRAAAVFRKPLS